jgi:methionyl-tRNA formyltransferase
MGAGLLVETLEGLAAGTIVPEPQDDAQATLAPLIKKEDGVINWVRSAKSIHDQVRGLQPWPGAQTRFRGAPLQVWKTRLVEQGSRTGLPACPPCAELPAVPGSIANLKPLVVRCGEGLLELVEVQMEGRKRISAADFANGQRLTENEILGEPRN